MTGIVNLTVGVCAGILFWFLVAWARSYFTWRTASRRKQAALRRAEEALRRWN